MAAKEAAYARLLKEHREALERVAGLTAEEAKRQLFEEMESQARLEAAGMPSAFSKRRRKMPNGKRARSLPVPSNG